MKHLVSITNACIGVIFLNCSAAIAQTLTTNEFHTKVIELYNFQPHLLDDSAINTKSKELDKFWRFASEQRSQILPLLREELASQGNPSFFFYDGAKLLLSLSEEKQDRALALSAIPRVDLLDIQTTDYLKTVHWFASKGFDTRKAALRILDNPKFKAFIPLHALKLDQDFCLIYMLFPMQDISFEADLATRLNSEIDTTAQKSILLALWYTVTPSSREVIQQFSTRENINIEVANYARELLNRQAGITFSLSSMESLRKERTKVMQQGISDEALGEFNALTRKILSKL